MAARDPAQRRSLRLEDWPAGDRAAWEALFAQGDVFAGAGPCRHWRPATRQTRQDGYALWLGWLAGQGALDPDAPPGARATPEAVRAFAAMRRARVAPLTVASGLVSLKAVLEGMHPEMAWSWLGTLCNRLGAGARPIVDRSAAIRPIEEIHGASARALDRLAAGPLASRDDRVAYRDMLIVLVLSAAPVRLRNLASIEIGRQLIQTGGRSRLRFMEGETKNRMRLDFDLPCHVEPYLALYLDRVRPSFGPAADCRGLWVSFRGDQLAAHSIRGRITLATGRLFGAPINPHSFRACGATSFAHRSPAMARQAAPLLGHRQFATTEKYYIKANHLAASRSVNAVLAELRGKLRKKRG